MKYGLNKTKIKLFTPQLGWFGGKKIELHPWDTRIKFPQMTFIVVNIGILIEYSIPT